MAAILLRSRRRFLRSSSSAVSCTNKHRKLIIVRHTLNVIGAIAGLEIELSETQKLWFFFNKRELREFSKITFLPIDLKAVARSEKTPIKILRTFIPEIEWQNIHL